MNILKKYFLFLTLICMSCALQAADTPKVVVSIPPLYALVSAVMKNVGTPTLLLQAGASPHHYSLKPSDAKHLYTADIIFWAGPELESFLTKILSNTQDLKPSVLNIALVESPQLLLLPIRTGATFEPHEHGDHTHHDHDHHHTDMHFWLDPMNAKVMVAYIADILSKADPLHAAEYQHNANTAKQTLTHLDMQLKQQLSPIQKKPYIVFHDAYQYFEHRYDLQGVGAISLNPEIPPSAKRVKHIQAIIHSTHALCVFSEPQFQSKIINTIIAGTSVHTGELDPLGPVTHQGLKDYIDLLENLTAALQGCLLLKNQ